MPPPLSLHNAYFFIYKSCFSVGLEQATKKPKIELNLGINLNNNSNSSNSSNNNSSTVVAVGPSGSRGGVDNAPLAQVEGINEEAVRRYVTVLSQVAQVVKCSCSYFQC